MVAIGVYQIYIVVLNKKKQDKYIIVQIVFRNRKKKKKKKKVVKHNFKLIVVKIYIFVKNVADKKIQKDAKRKH